MDGARFDRLTKDLAGGLASRRLLLGSVIAGSVLVLRGGLSLDAVVAKKKRKGKGKGKKKKKTSSPTPVSPTVCPANARFCAPPTGGPCNAAGTCTCGSRGDGSGFCADCAHCINPQCVSDADCLARGLPAGTVCGDGTGGFCEPCTRVCITPCGSCPNCSCQPN
jgi:hypothetical protein